MPSLPRLIVNIATAVAGIFYGGNNPAGTGQAPSTGLVSTKYNAVATLPPAATFPPVSGMTTPMPYGGRTLQDSISHANTPSWKKQGEVATLFAGSGTRSAPPTMSPSSGMESVVNPAGHVINAASNPSSVAGSSPPPPKVTTAPSQPAPVASSQGKGIV